MKSKTIIAGYSLLLFVGCDNKAPKEVKVPDSAQAEQLKVAEKRIVHLERTLKEATDLQDRQSDRITELTIQLAQKEVAAATTATHTPSPGSATYPAASTYREATVTQNHATYSVPQITPAPTLKWWNPPTQYTATKEIKESAIAEWKDDYTMVEHRIKRQTEALQKLIQINRTATKPVKDIIAKAVEQWDKDYSMVLHVVERQTEALQRLQGR